MHFYSPEEEPDASRRRDLTIEVVKLLTATIALLAAILGLVAKFSWFSKPRVLDGLIVVGCLFVAWFAKPRLGAWWSRITQRKRERKFIKASDEQLHEFVEQICPIYFRQQHAIVDLYCSNRLPTLDRTGTASWRLHWELVSFIS